MEVGGRWRINSRLMVMALLLSLVPLAPAQSRRRDNSDISATAAESELQTAIAMTRRGQFQEAIPHYLAVEGRVADEYPVHFNLALCYVATGEFEKAIPLLTTLPAEKRNAGNVQNLLAQAYIGAGQSDKAFAAIQQAAKAAPKDQKQYLYIADACMSAGDYGLGLKAMDLGLSNVPTSPQMHYERAMFLSLRDRLDEAKQEFDTTTQLARGDAIGYVAAAQKDLFVGDVAGAVKAAREGAQRNRADFLLLAVLGEALIRSGIAPGQPDFAEARAALDKSVSLRPNYADSQIALAKLDLMDNRVADAVARLETAQQLEPRNAAVYSNLAAAYRRAGEMQKAQAALAVLAQINQQQAARIGSAPGDRKAGYAQQVH